MRNRNSPLSGCCFGAALDAHAAATAGVKAGPKGKKARRAEEGAASAGEAVKERGEGGRGER